MARVRRQRYAMRDLFETILMFLVFLVIGLAVFIWWFEHKWKNQHKYDLRL